VTTAPAAPDPGTEPATPAVRDRGWRRESLLAVAVAVALAATGLPLGLLWRAITPKVEFVMTEQGPTPTQPEPEGFVAGDGWYVLITFVAGLLAAVAVWALIRRRRGPLMLLGLLAGCVAGGALTAWLGHYIGYADYRQLITNAPVGAHFLRPPSVRSGEVGLWFGFLPRVQGAVLVQAVTAAMVYLMLAAFHVDPDLRQPAEGDFAGQPYDQANSADPADQANPADPVSWASTGSPVPSEPPARPGSDPAVSPRD
jgi:peptidoglycan/LPS O-acetylase OafA/YrhL